MKFIEQRIAQVAIIFEQYKGDEPLHLFLKKWFKRQKKFGSRDRREIAECLYGLFRIGRENRHLSIRERVYFFLFLKGEFPKSFFEENYKELAPKCDLSLNDKIVFLRSEYELRETFRTQEEISERIDLESYRSSFYLEPKVFIRLRNNTHEKYEVTIETLGGEFVNERCVAFDSKVKLEEHFELADYVVQDFNSQQTANYFPPLADGDTVWDTCAGSGGKSILLLDSFPHIALTATDVRASILRNLIERFEQYGLNAEVIAEGNVNKDNDLEVLEDSKFDFVLCDVPCTGSGTWARTPEQFYYFEKKEIAKFHKRQLDILTNASQRLKEGKQLLYITCSVFAKENEEVIKQFLIDNNSFSLLESAYLDGSRLQADTLYVATLKKE